MISTSTALIALTVSCADRPTPEVAVQERPQQQPAAAQVTGSITYRERIALPTGAVLVVRLEDVSRQDAPAAMLAEHAMTLAGRQVPLPFTLTFDPGAIRETGSYEVRASIRTAREGPAELTGEALFATTRGYPVLTRGGPRSVELVLDRVRVAATPAPASPNDPWDAARARGVSFRAVGNEPGWMLEIEEGERVTMLADYGEKRVTTPAPAPSKDPSTGDRLYTIRTEAHRLDIRIEARQCQDGMSGFEFPSTVTATLDGRTYQGCGRALR